MNKNKDGVERPDTKQVFRKLMLEQRKNMLLSDVEEKSKAIVSNILSTTEYKNADCIYMFENGRVIENGTHKELMTLNGKYAQMFRIQAEKYAAKTGESEFNV